jgi:hypothetical protein
MYGCCAYPGVCLAPITTPCSTAARTSAQHQSASKLQHSKVPQQDCTITPHRYCSSICTRQVAPPYAILPRSTSTEYGAARRTRRYHRKHCTGTFQPSWLLSCSWQQLYSTAAGSCLLSCLKVPCYKQLHHTHTPAGCLHHSPSAPAASSSCHAPRCTQLSTPHSASPPSALYNTGETQTS